MISKILKSRTKFVDFGNNPIHICKSAEKVSDKMAPDCHNARARFQWIRSDRWFGMSVFVIFVKKWLNWKENVESAIVFQMLHLQGHTCLCDSNKWLTEQFNLAHNWSNWKQCCLPCFIFGVINVSSWFWLWTTFEKCFHAEFQWRGQLLSWLVESLLSSTWEKATAFQNAMKINANHQWFSLEWISMWMRRSTTLRQVVRWVVFVEDSTS